MKSTKKHFDIGPRPLLFERNSTYEEVMEKMKTTFFPNGKSFLGKIEKMQSRLGNAKGDTIEDSPVFTLGTFVDSCTAQKPRIYILTKTQISTFDPDTSSDSDFSLPDLGFEYTGTAFNSAQHTVSNSVATAAAGAPSDQSLLSPIVQGPVPLETSTPMTFATSSAASSGTNDFRDAGTPTVSLRVPDSTCCICYERQKNAFFIPCGHTACMVCGVQLQSSRRSCHQCRGNIQMVKSIFE
ncbi:uncharacterized protein [Argopecten irradians]|uniref:uncharacterized protein n=1 Tax=Argopecten irradians TaxID=31199 RepID=UPI0037177BF7